LAEELLKVKVTKYYLVIKTPPPAGGGWGVI